MFVNGVTRGNVGPWSPNQVRTIAATINRINGEAQRGPKAPPPPVVVFMARFRG